MNGAETSAVFRFEGDLKIGDEVTVYWGTNLRSCGTVSRLLRKHIQVTITRPHPEDASVYVGKEVRVPKIEAHSVWRPDNRVEPSGGYFHPDIPKYRDIPFERAA